METNLEYIIIINCRPETEHLPTNSVIKYYGLKLASGYKFTSDFGCLGYTQETTLTVHTELNLVAKIGYGWHLW